MTKPFKITGPGRYRMRNGKSVRIRAWPLRKHPEFYEDFSWEGADDDSYCWQDDGSFMARGTPSKWDLVRRLPAPKPRKRTAAKRASQWGVWVPCDNRTDARAYARTIWHRIDFPSKSKPVVKRSAS